MNQQRDQQLLQKVIPDGEGFNALPIFFIFVIASGFALAMTPERKI
jgi:hypothetical protein